LIVSVTPIIGMEVHIELATHTKMFSRALSPSFAGNEDAAPNTYLDPTVLGLPGALPVMNRRAVELSVLIGLALNCRINAPSVWDRKNYFYPDSPKAYQISQYQLPLCEDGFLEVPAADDAGFPDFATAPRRIGIVRAHLEEDAGKLSHEGPGGASIDHSLVDFNRAGTPLLEVVTAPDFSSSEQCVMFARTLRNIARFLEATLGVMQRGHMRFEPNINLELVLADGRTVRTPIVEVKNLNSFRSLKGAIEFEIREQPGRFLADGRVMGRGAKTTRGWDDAHERTFVQREKEDAHDYRYFPDPDLPPVTVDESWTTAIAASLLELPLARCKRYMTEFGLAVKEASALAEDRGPCLFFEACIEELRGRGIAPARAGKLASNMLLGPAQKRANERSVALHEVGITAHGIAALGVLREAGRIGNQAVDELFAALCETPSADAEAVAAEHHLLIVKDDAALDGWISLVFAANPKVVEDVKAGKVAAAGRLVGEVMKLAAGKADAKTVRETILAKLA